MFADESGGVVVSVSSKVLVSASLFVSESVSVLYIINIRLILRTLRCISRW